MDTLTEYRQIVERMLSDYAGMSYAYGDIKDETVFDREHDRYLLMSVGWNKGRVHGCVIHIDIIEGKLWLQCDNTDRGIAMELVAAGIPREHIVLGFRPPELRQYTDFAAA
jgi:XisI protein